MITNRRYDPDLPEKIGSVGDHKPRWDWVDDYDTWSSGHVLVCDACGDEDWPCDVAQLVIAALRALPNSPEAWLRADQLEGPRS